MANRLERDGRAAVKEIDNIMDMFVEELNRLENEVEALTKENSRLENRVLELEVDLEEEKHK